MDTYRCERASAVSGADIRTTISPWIALRLGAGKLIDDRKELKYSDDMGYCGGYMT